MISRRPQEARNPISSPARLYMDADGHHIRLTDEVRWEQAKTRST